MAASPAGGFNVPGELSAILEWLPACVPGTVAGALAVAGRWSIDAPAPLHGQDYWYSTEIAADTHGTGPATLTFEGLATLAQVWFDDRLILASESMFIAHAADVVLTGRHRLHICFRALQPALAKSRTKQRARWRPRMIDSQNLRAIRTTLIGHMPGWCPPVHVIGPWRAIHIAAHSKPRVLDRSVQTQLSGTTGIVHVRLNLAHAGDGPVLLTVGDTSTPLQRAGSNIWEGRLEVPGVRQWWPHTHGTPALYPLGASFAGGNLPLGRIGFRNLSIERGQDGRGFEVIVNGVPVFCRGAIWSSADLARIPQTATAYRPWLEQLRDANLNMVRIPGTMVYEGQAFHDLCDELGILVWQDFMFANFDYPAEDAAFVKSVTIEVAQYLQQRQLSPSLAVLCGGSEVHQQATMLGLPAKMTANAIFDEIMPRAISEIRPDVAYVPNSPCTFDHDRELPFSVSSGVAHYFGVGAYLRPLDDARRSGVRFASECLAFANLPESATLERTLAVPIFHHPKWKERTPRDQGAAWDFEDVRDHYLSAHFGLDARALRIADSDRYALASRAVVAEIMEITLGEWRRFGSVTRGALVLMLQDLWPGAGWGIVDSVGEPKSPWYALKRACQPLQIVLSDEGLEGLNVHVVNETDVARALKVSLHCLRHGHTPVIDAHLDIELGPRSAQRVSSTQIIGAFFDITNAYRFGPPAHDVIIATLSDRATGEPLSRAFHLPSSMVRDPVSTGLRGELTRAGDGQWLLDIACDRFARCVQISDRHFRPDDNYFNLDPRGARRIRLTPRSWAVVDAVPGGEVTALNATDLMIYGGP
jgi:beta-mannosidase